MSSRKLQPNYNIAFILKNYNQIEKLMSSRKLQPNYNINIIS